MYFVTNAGFGQVACADQGNGAAFVGGPGEHGLAAHGMAIGDH